MTIVSLQDTKVALGISDATQDDRIADLVLTVSALAEKIAGRPFSQATRVEDHKGGMPSLFLRALPVASITSVIDIETGNTIASTGYSLDATNGILRRVPLGTKWTESVPGIPIYRVTYVGGPAAPPADVRLACYEIISAMLRGDGGLQSESEGDYSYTNAVNPEGLPSSALGVLRSHRLAF